MRAIGPAFSQAERRSADTDHARRLLEHEKGAHPAAGPPAFANPPHGRPARRTSARFVLSRRPPRPRPFMRRDA
jgi:hypothetical protein